MMVVIVIGLLLVTAAALAAGYVLGRASELHDDLSQDLICDPRQARQKAFQALQDAKARNDDRDTGEALKALREATNAQLRREVAA
jgi:hypothetical protein